MLKLIDLDIPELGYRKFITAWLYSGEEGNFLVDTGPVCTTDALFAGISDAGVDHLDWILLTHIHLDHSGGLGHVVKRFPEATVVCHEKGAPHLEDPSKLWDASLKTIGKVAEIYGQMAPVPADRLVQMEEIPFGGGIRVIATPGHAAHHQSYVFSDWLFCGELLGIYLDLGGRTYLRPATPPRFILDEFLSSMNRISPYADRKLCFSHYGMSPDGRKILDTSREQLNLWVEVVRSHLKAEGGAASEQADLDEISADLMARDPIFAQIRELPADLMAREKYYVKNSIRGIMAYLKDLRG